MVLLRHDHEPCNTFFQNAAISFQGAHQILLEDLRPHITISTPSSLRIDSVFGLWNRRFEEQLRLLTMPQEPTYEERLQPIFASKGRLAISRYRILLFVGFV
jgi:hypothetical protein